MHRVPWADKSLTDHKRCLKATAPLLLAPGAPRPLTRGGGEGTRVPFSRGVCAGAAFGLHLAASTETCWEGRVGGMNLWKGPHRHGDPNITQKSLVWEVTLNSRPWSWDLGRPLPQPAILATASPHWRGGAAWCCGVHGGTSRHGPPWTRWPSVRGRGRRGAGEAGRAARHLSPFCLLGSQALIWPGPALPADGGLSSA